MREFVTLLVEALDSYDNRLDSEEAINNILADFYLDRNQKIRNEEYSFLIRHVTTHTLRAYFDKIANKHNNLLCGENNEKLRFVLDYPIILSTSEHEAYKKSIEDFKQTRRKTFDPLSPNVLEPKTIDWIHTELDSDWHYKGHVTTAAEGASLSHPTVCKYIDPISLGIKVGNLKPILRADFQCCCICQQFVTSCWTYTVDNVHYNVCRNCMEKNPNLN